MLVGMNLLLKPFRHAEKCNAFIQYLQIDSDLMAIPAKFQNDGINTLVNSLNNPKYPTFARVVGVD